MSTPPEILVVDDEAPVLDTVGEWLRRADMIVHTADGYESAWDLMGTNPIDLVITDMDMPGKTGRDLLVAVKQHYADVPVIILTGKALMDAAVDCFRVGAADFITKPCDFPRLIERTRELVAERHSRMAVGLDGGARSVRGYELLEQIGEGAMGIVFRSEKNGVSVAIKIMKEMTVNCKDRMERTERFMREAKLAAAIHHPNVVRVLDSGVTERDELPYMVMEYVDGQELKGLHEHPRFAAIEDRVNIILQVAEGLAAIHEQDVVHRDLKPSNVLVDLAGSPLARITDFGVAQVMDSDLTARGQVVGSPLYMSPEGFHGTKIDKLGDFFSLGTLAYEFFTGQHPFRGPTLLATIQKVLNSQPRPPTHFIPDFPPKLEIILNQLLQKHKEDRYQTLEELIADLQQVFRPQVPKRKRRFLGFIPLPSFPSERR